jgi:uncharacterized PurR-regulated membrane protein YhhQ (DUF165 family)|tara:strand:+ start:1056 stop:1553 length:498 start_codon:yes stop_codon:yes gene_type:complete
MKQINIYVVVYLVAIVAANLTVNHFGPSASIFIAFLFIGLDLSIRDQLHDSWQNDKLIIKMLALIVSGSVITILLNLEAMQIAVASATAFGVAAIGDAVVYHYLRKRIFLVRANGSNVAGAGLDSLIFPTIAFGGLMPWIVLGQFVAKILGGLLFSLIIERFRKQ